ncbi:MAG: proton-conducting transporter membrane subunit [Candidatus Phosphoribacter sp.]|nr:hydrogenase [Actinomycetales bacterium]
MGAMLWLPVLVPVALGALAAAGRGAPWTRLLDLVAALTILATGLVLLTGTLSAPYAASAAGGLLRADALTAYLVVTIGAVATVALWGALSTPGTADGWFTALVCLFLAAMSLAVLADNLGVLWVAIEATTITTAFLVGYHPGRAPLEAAWKYVVLGSVGVAIAFLGIVVLYATSRAAGAPTLSWVELVALAPRLDPEAAKLGVALTILGLATKAGLAPMHSWLPDAHSQAPAPVSGLMSGVLLSVALYAVMRVGVIGDLALGTGFVRGLLLALGLLSLAVAAALMFTQRDYKRLLAYSSIEHMGLMAIGVAIGGPLATTAVLVHMLGHGLIKAALFVQAGRILASEGSTRIGDVTGLLARRPDLAGPFLAGGAALLGLPPFALFFTEVALVVAGWQAGLWAPMALVLALLLLAFAGMSRQLVRMTLGAGGRSLDEPASARLSRGALAPVLAALVVAAGLAALAVPLSGALGSAVESLAVLR